MEVNDDENDEEIDNENDEDLDVPEEILFDEDDEDQEFNLDEEAFDEVKEKNKMTAERKR